MTLMTVAIDAIARTAPTNAPDTIAAAQTASAWACPSAKFLPKVRGTLKRSIPPALQVRTNALRPVG